MRFGLRELIFVLLLISTVIGAYFMLYAPRREQLSEAMAEVNEKLAKLDQLEEAARRISDLGDEIDRLTEAIAAFEEKLPAQREVEVILKQVWELAAKEGLTPKSVHADKKLDTAQYSELPLKMVFVGNFDGFYSFLLELEKLPRITQLSKMKLKKLNDQEGQMQADIVLSIFFEGANKSSVDKRKGRA